MFVPNAKRTFEGRIRSLSACTAATRCGRSHSSSGVTGNARKNSSRNADTGEVTAALPIASASGREEVGLRFSAWVIELHVKVQSEWQLQGGQFAGELPLVAGS